MRTTIDLNSGWQFSAAGEPFRNVTLPHCAFPEPVVIDEPRTGLATYRIAIVPKPEWKGKVVHLEIGAAMQSARVYLNDRYRFTHLGGYQRFLVPLMDELVPGEETIVRIELDNRPSEDMPPGKPVKRLDFCYHSGLYREARLLIDDRLHISDELAVSIPAGGGVFVRTEGIDGGTAHVAIDCHVLNEVPQSERWDFLGRERERQPVSVRARVLGPDGATLADATSEGRVIPFNGDATFSFHLDVADAPLWSCETPNLCVARVEVLRAGEVVDARDVRFGIRTIAFTREGFFLNGVKTALLGTNRHMEYPGVGNAVPANAQRRDAALIKRGGLNFVRLSHYPQHPAFYDACDELGLLVMAPIAGWQYFATNDAFITNAFRDVRQLVRLFRNHPSVILWEASLNESYPPHWINAGLCRIAHEEYPGPQCYVCGDLIGGFNGWDVPFFSSDEDDLGKPVILREYGDWGFGGNASTSRRERKDGPAELLRQAWNFQWSLNRALALPGIVGTNDWCFIDYNRGCAPRIETSGSVDVFRHPKPKFDFYRSQGAAEPMVVPVRCGGKVVVFSNCDEVELRLADGSAFARQRPDHGPNTPYNPTAETSPDWETARLLGADTSGGRPYDGGNCARLPHPPFTFTGVPEDADFDVVGYRDGAEAARAPLYIPGPADHVEVRVRDEGIPVVPGDLVFADAVLVDARGTTIPESRPVRFLATAGEIVIAADRVEAGVASCLVRADADGRIALSAEICPA